eukprot:1243034-Rhodomonas_salina.2
MGRVEGRRAVIGECVIQGSGWGQEEGGGQEPEAWASAQGAGDSSAHVLAGRLPTGWGEDDSIDSRKRACLGRVALADRTVSG